MATPRGEDPGPPAGDRLRPGAQRPPERRTTLLSELADLEPDRLTPAKRLVAAGTLIVVVLAMALAAALLVYTLFDAIG